LISSDGRSEGDAAGAKTAALLASAIFINRCRRPGGGASRPSNLDGHSRPSDESDSSEARRRHIDTVCTENLIRVDDVVESPKLAK